MDFIIAILATAFAVCLAYVSLPPLRYFEVMLALYHQLFEQLSSRFGDKEIWSEVIKRVEERLKRRSLTDDDVKIFVDQYRTFRPIHLENLRVIHRLQCLLFGRNSIVLDRKNDAKYWKDVYFASPHMDNARLDAGRFINFSPSLVLDSMADGICEIILHDRDFYLKGDSTNIRHIPNGDRRDQVANILMIYFRSGTDKLVVEALALIIGLLLFFKASGSVTFLEGNEYKELFYGMFFSILSAYFYAISLPSRSLITSCLLTVIGSCHLFVAILYFGNEYLFFSVLIMTMSIFFGIASALTHRLRKYDTEWSWEKVISAIFLFIIGYSFFPIFFWSILFFDLHILHQGVYQNFFSFVQGISDFFKEVQESSSAGPIEVFLCMFGMIVPTINVIYGRYCRNLAYNIAHILCIAGRSTGEGMAETIDKEDFSS